MARPAAHDRPSLATAAVADGRRRTNLLLGSGLALAVLAILALAGLGSRSSTSPGTTDPDLVREAALRSCPSGSASTASSELPADELPCLTGGTVSLASLTGTPLVINVWGSWCPPCRDELPWFAALDDEAGPRLQIVGVDVVDTDRAALETLIASNVHYPVVVDPSGRTRGSLGWTSGTPVTLLVSPQGEVVHRIVGRVPDEVTLRRLVEQYLAVDLGPA